MSKLQLAALFLRWTLAASFLSAVADRFGIWGSIGSGEVAWGTFPQFVDYTQLLLWFVPAVAVVPLAWSATILEITLALGLIFGIATRCVAVASGVLLLTFAIGMTFGTGPEGALSYSVWTAAAAAFLLAAVLDEKKTEASASREI